VRAKIVPRLRRQGFVLKTKKKKQEEVRDVSKKKGEYEKGRGTCNENLSMGFPVMMGQHSVTRLLEQRAGRNQKTVDLQNCYPGTSIR